MTRLIVPTSASAVLKVRQLSGRCLFYLACAVLWAIVGAGMLEAWARIRPAPPVNTPETIPFTVRSAREYFSDVYSRYCSDWPLPIPDVPDLEDFARANESRRSEIAEMRGEWVLAVDMEGMVRRTYGTPPRILAGLEAPPPFPLSLLSDKGGIALPATFLAEVVSGNLPAPSTIAAGMDDDAEMLHVVTMPCGGSGNPRHTLLVLRPSIYRPGQKRFKPNTDLTIFTDTVLMEQFSTNSLGHRGPEIIVPKPRDRVRVACIGGSTTVWGFRDTLTYPAILETLLREHFPDEAERIEVVNCGVFGLNSSDEAAMLAEVALLEPDILVHYNFINDLALHFRNWLHGPDEDRPKADRFKLLLRRSQFLNQCANPCLLPSEERLRDYLRRTTLANLAQVVEAAQEHGMRVSLCSFAGIDPAKVAKQHRAYAEQIHIRSLFPDLDLNAYTRVRALYNEELRNLCTRMNARYIPVAEEVLAGYDLFMDECHLNPLGTEHQAIVIFKHLVEVVAQCL